MGEDSGEPRAKRRRRGEAAAGEALASEPQGTLPLIILRPKPERQSRAQQLLQQVAGLCRGLLDVCSRTPCVARNLPPVLLRTSALASLFCNPVAMACHGSSCACAPADLLGPVAEDAAHNCRAS